jgi:uncharacterized protein (TIGR03546 family)
MSETMIGLLHKSSSHNRPSQIAWAVVWGCVCGLMPKTSLMFPICLLASFVLPIHFVAACVCTIATSCLTPILHPILGNLGHWVFQSERVLQLVHRIDNIPLVPWLKLHNTVVIGATAVCLCLAFPLQWIVKQILVRPYVAWLQAEHHRQLTESLRVESERKQTVVVELDDSAFNKPPQVAPQVEPRPLAASISLAGEPNASSLNEAIDSIHALEDLLEKVSLDTDGKYDASSVLARATKATELIDEILFSIDSLESPSSKALTSNTAENIQVVEEIAVTDNRDSADSLTGVDSEVSAQATSDAPSESFGAMALVRIDAPQTFQLHDTKISIYRRARTGETVVSGSGQGTQSEKEPMPANDTSTDQANLAVVEPPQPSNSTIRSVSNAGTSNNSNSVRADVESRHEEALRHLLSHLRALKEKV